MVEVETAVESQSTDSGALATAGGVGVAQDVHLGGALVAGGDLAAREAVQVGQRAVFGAKVVAAKGADLGGRGLRCEGGGSITGVASLAVEGEAAVSGSLSVGGSLEVGRDARVAGRLVVGGEEEDEAALTTAGGIFVAQRAHFGGAVEASSLDAMMHGLTLAGGSIAGASSVEVEGRVEAGGMEVSAGGMGVSGSLRVAGNLAVGSGFATHGGVGVSGSVVLNAGLSVGPLESDGVPSMIISGGAAPPVALFLAEEERGEGGEKGQGDRRDEDRSKGISFEAFDGEGFASIAQITGDEQAGLTVAVAGRPALCVGMEGNVRVISSEPAALSLAGGVAVGGTFKVGG